MNGLIDKDSRVYCRQGPQRLLPISEGLLSGYTFVFKDLFDVKGYVTGAGNPTWLETHNMAEQTSPLILALLSQGANCVGRVQSDELAYSLNGQNIHYGTPVNPIAPNCLPGGSSSGSAVAVASKDADFSIGTDTGGSVRVPASYCGLYGLRPTLAKFNLEHCFELAKSFDTAGIFTRDLDLMHKVFEVLNGAPVKGESAQTLYLDKTLAAQLSDQRLKRLQVCCIEAGITLLNGDFLAKYHLSLEAISLLFRTVQGYEIIAKHREWLAEFGHSLEPSIYQRVEWSRTISAEQYTQAKKRQTDFRLQLTVLLQQQGGLWLVPTTPSGPPSLSLAGDQLAKYRSNLMGLTSIAGLSGFPQLHLPIKGLEEGPCGISLLGLPDSEGDLFATAQQLIQGKQL
ncbi:Amidase [Psychromonas ingrahamii 37]|uniref:Amidase n=1 Tax=Psychromonas ingrahamii (strain DSM 17664 / CCUG 51855 / 37) TaxID=357804 RepID=A1SXE3_PSYIN|nr:amidase [Psychromonas ingrahamii]ABM04158.1 Amidase [Psychromonas ingrahamii 37]